MGVSDKQSSRWQALADIPEAEFQRGLRGPDKPTTERLSFDAGGGAVALCEIRRPVQEGEPVEGALRREGLRLRAGVIVAALTLFGSATAGPAEDAQTAFAKGDYATAFQIWRPLAEQGDAYAQLCVALSYRDGQGVTRDYAQAVVWFLKIANQGDDKYGDLAQSMAC
jgi:hypothetical protein